MNKKSISESKIKYGEKRTPRLLQYELFKHTPMNQGPNKPPCNDIREI